MTRKGGQQIKESQELKELERQIRQAVEASIAFDASSESDSRLNPDKGWRAFNELLGIPKENMPSRSHQYIVNATEFDKEMKTLFNNLKVEFSDVKKQKLTSARAAELTGIAIGKTIVALAATAARLIGDGLIVSGKLLNFASLGLVNTIVPGGRQAQGNEIMNQHAKPGMRNWGSVMLGELKGEETWGNINIIERLGYKLANAGVAGQDFARSGWKDPLNKPEINGIATKIATQRKELGK